MMLKLGIIAAILLPALFWLTLLMLSRYEYQKGLNALAMEQYDAALSAFTAADKILPDSLLSTLAPRDLFRILLPWDRVCIIWLRQPETGVRPLEPNNF